MTLDQRQNSKLLMGIIAGLITVVAIFLAYQWMTSSQPNHELEQPVVRAAVKPAAQALAPATETAASTATADAAEAPIQLVDESLLKQDVPKNAALAKEEIAKLDDLQTQLNEQEKMLKAQHSDADDLIALKEEQIKLLEAQLAQAQ